MSEKIDLNSPEVKAAIAAAVEEANAPLVAKRDELLAEVKKLRQGKQVSPEELAALEAERDNLQAQLKDAQKAVKTATTEAENAKKALEAESGFTTKLLADNGLADALVKVGVNNPAHLKAVKALLAGQVQIVKEGDQRVAKVGDKPLVDFVQDWAKSDEGKNFVSASQHQGGGSHGGDPSNKGNKTMTRAQFDALSPEARATVVKDTAIVD